MTECSLVGHEKALAGDAERDVAAMVYRRMIASDEKSVVAGGERSVEEQMIGYYGAAPSVGHGQSLDDVVGAVAYGLVEFGDGQRVADVRCDGAFGRVAVERNEIGDDHWIEAHAIESVDARRFDGVQLVEERMTECSLVGHEKAMAGDAELGVEAGVYRRSLESGAVDGELSVGAQKIGSWGGAPWAGNGQWLGDVEVAGAYG
jgi:hypothetical protein